MYAKMRMLSIVASIGLILSFGAAAYSFNQYMVLNSMHEKVMLLSLDDGLATQIAKEDVSDQHRRSLIVNKLTSNEKRIGSLKSSLTSMIVDWKRHAIYEGSFSVTVFLLFTIVLGRCLALRKREGG